MTKSEAKYFLMLKLKYLTRTNLLSSVRLFEKLDLTELELLSFFSIFGFNLKKKILHLLMKDPAHPEGKRETDKTIKSLLEKKLIRLNKRGTVIIREKKPLNLKRYIRIAEFNDLIDAIEQACINNMDEIRQLLFSNNSLKKKIAFEILRVKDINFIKEYCTVFLVDDILSKKMKELYRKLLIVR